MTKGFTYKSYNFQDKDPIIDEIRTIFQAAHVTKQWVEDESGVTSTTLHAWFDGKTRRPQAATINAVARALGYKLGFVPYEAISEPAKASMGHVVRMAKIRRAR
jgi:transcriptional regulator with XRE-family HTH domain